MQNKTPRSQRNTFVVVTLWILGLSGVLISGLFLLAGFSLWFILWLLLWGVCAMFLWRRRFVTTIAHGKIIVSGIAMVIVSLVLVDMSMPTAEEMRDTHDQLITDAERVINDNNAAKNEPRDDVAAFIESLVATAGEDPAMISSDTEVLWTAKGMSLKTSNARSTVLPTTSDAVWSDLQQYIIAVGGSHGTIGFTFEDRSPYEQVGYIVDDEPYIGLMCILTRDSEQIMIGCGWGPGGGA